MRQSRMATGSLQKLRIISWCTILHTFSAFNTEGHMRFHSCFNQEQESEATIGIMKSVQLKIGKVPGGKTPTVRPLTWDWLSHIAQMRKLQSNREFTPMMKFQWRIQGQKYLLEIVLYASVTQVSFSAFFQRSCPSKTLHHVPDAWRTAFSTQYGLTFTFCAEFDQVITGGLVITCLWIPPSDLAPWLGPSNTNPDWGSLKSLFVWSLCHVCSSRLAILQGNKLLET